MKENELYDFMIQNLKHDKSKKEKFGEVFTHPDLINKILDLLPSNSWSNPDGKWLEPACGMGFFSVLIYGRLDKGLKHTIPNDKKRSEHILKNMLYMVELNKKNCNICRQIFGKKANITCGDFLSLTDISNTNFDYIIGNPPFQDDYGLNKDEKKILGGKSKLYEKFFLKCYELLNEKGYISFIVPDNIFSGNGVESYNKMLQGHVKFVSFSNNIIDYFPGLYNIKMCYFLLKKGEDNKRKLVTTIETNENNQFKVILQNRPVNPVANWTSKTEMLTKKYILNDRNTIVYNRGKALDMYKGNKYKLIYTPEKFLTTNSIDLAVGHGIKKAVVFLISPDLEFKMDYIGNYGVGPNTFYIPFETNVEGRNIEKFLNSSDYKDLALATKTNRKFLKLAFMEYLNFNKIIQTNSNKTKKNHKTKIIKTSKTRKQVKQENK